MRKIGDVVETDGGLGILLRNEKVFVDGKVLNVLNKDLNEEVLHFYEDICWEPPVGFKRINK